MNCGVDQTADIDLCVYVCHVSCVFFPLCSQIIGICGSMLPVIPNACSEEPSVKVTREVLF